MTMTANRAPIDFVGISRPVFERLLGEHNSKESTLDELRWGEKGHIRLNLSKGTWQNFYDKSGGGLLAFLEAHLKTDQRGAFEWLTNEGFIEPMSNAVAARRRIARRKNRPGKTDKNTEYDSQIRDASSQPKQTDASRQSILYKAYNSSDVVPADESHPVRLWAEKHNAWRSNLAFPKGARWLPSHSDFYNGKHLGAGSITILCAPLSTWQKSYPSPPRPQAVQLIGLSAEGEPALDRSEDHVNKKGKSSPGRMKRNHGLSKDAVFCIGDPRPDYTEGVAVCEGLKDALSLASRLPLTAIAFLGAPPPEAAKDLALYKKVELYPDADHAGGAWSAQLASLVSAYGTDTTIHNVVWGSDPGEAGVGLIKGESDIAESVKSRLVAAGAQEHDAARLGEVAAQNEAVAAKGETVRDGILHAARKQPQPHPGLAALTALRLALSSPDGEITHAKSSEILKLLNDAKILARKDKNNLVRLIEALENQLLTGIDLEVDLIEQLESAVLEMQVARLSKVSASKAKWAIEDFIPQGALCALWQEAGRAKDELEGAVNLLLARVLTLEDDERCALVPLLHKQDWLSSYLRHAALSKILVAHTSYAANMAGDDGYEYRGMSAAFKSLLVDMERSNVKMIWLPATALPYETHSQRGFLSDLRSWCDSADATVVVSYISIPADPSQYQFTYSATRFDGAPNAAIQYRAHKQSARLAKSRVTLLNDGSSPH